VAVVGGGVAGLAAAWELRTRTEVTVYEPGHLGGKVLTSDFCGRPVDEGPDAFITRQPAALELCQQLGLDGDLVAPAAGRSLLWWNGKLRPLPEGLALGVPTQLGSLATSGLLSPAGVARAALDVVLPRRLDPAEASVRQLVADRFGAQVADRLVDPLVGGIHAGTTDQLGAAEVAPQLVTAAQRSRSLLRGLRGPRASPGSPLFLAPRGGTEAISLRLVEALKGDGVSFADTAVTAMAAVGAAGRPQVAVAPADDAFDGVVLAAPAPVAASLLAQPAPAEGAALAGIAYASVVLVTLMFPGDVAPPGVNGFLVPRQEGALMTACSFGSSKWPHWAPPGQTLVRLSAGRHGDARALELDDESLVERLSAELKRFTGWRADPAAWRVSRWADSFPQYSIGHERRVADVERGLAQHLPAVILAGAAYGGVGIPACVASGRRAATTLTERLAAW
jgi:oxygen-dependent protoporphyrinogen oxidase